jgi:hypothetical protein
MARPAFVKIRFLGGEWTKGVPKRRQIMVGGNRFWNHKKFREQTDDGGYMRTLEFCVKHKEILSKKASFVLEYQNKRGDWIEFRFKDDDETSPLTTELAEKGVVEVEGKLLCPHCDYIDENTRRMALHMAEHE